MPLVSFHFGPLVYQLGHIVQDTAMTTVQNIYEKYNYISVMVLRKSIQR